MHANGDDGLSFAVRTCPVTLSVAFDCENARRPVSVRFALITSGLGGSAVRCFISLCPKVWLTRLGFGELGLTPGSIRPGGAAPSLSGRIRIHKNIAEQFVGHKSVEIKSKMRPLRVIPCHSHVLAKEIIFQSKTTRWGGATFV